MMLRVLWPCHAPAADHSDPCLLLGALLSSTQHTKTVITAAVVALCPLELVQPDIQHLLACTRVSLPTQASEAALAVLGIWQPESDAASHPGSRTQAAATQQQHGLWLSCRGRLPLQQTFSSWQHQTQLQAPACDLQQCVLPPGMQCIQFFLYAVPAQQQPDLAHVRLPVPPPAPQLPWMAPQRGAASLSAVMHMLQEAHAAIQLQQQQQTPCMPADQNLHPGQHLSNAQQPTPAHVPQTHQGWDDLAAVLSVADSSCRTASRVKQRLHLSSQGIVGALQSMAPNPHPAAASTTPAVPGAHCSQAEPTEWQQQQPQQQAAVSSAVAAAEPGSRSSSSHDAGGVLQLLLVQHLLGLLVAINLVMHRQLVLDAAAGGAVWLHHEVLQPHILWLTQAHPGGVKLHLELSLLLGTAADACLQLAVGFYTWSWSWLGPAALTAQAAAAAVGGASRGCAAAADILFAVLWPLVLLYVLCAGLHRLQLRCLAATWRLIRGKQKVRRFSMHHRTQPGQQQAHSSSSSSTINTASKSPPAAASTAAAAGGDSSEPSDEVSVEQLIVGVLLFTPLLGLLPTTAAWYLSVCWLYAMLHGVRLLLLVVGSWMQLRPLHVLAARLRRPQLFPGQLMVLPLQHPAVGALGATQVTHTVSQNNNSSHCDATAAGGSSSSRGAKHDGADTGGSGSVPVAYYNAFYEPLGYGDVLAQSIAQQQGLLWYACQESSGGGVEGGGGAGNTAWPLCWLKDVFTGRTWGLRVLSARWRFL